jgi:hypothetical protein
MLSYQIKLNRMKRIFFLGMFIPSFLMAQVVYRTSGGEIITSFADMITSGGADLSSAKRLSMAFHFHENRHINFNNNVGLFTGVAFRNIGFVSVEDNEKVKRRVYTLGIPAAIKLGNFRENLFAFGGLEGEFAINYKEKRFRGGKKVEKFNEWFSGRTQIFLPSAFAGVQFQDGLNLRFKVYLDEFLNSAFVEQYGNQIIEPYKDIRTNLFYFSLTYEFESGKRRLGKKSKNEEREKTYF